MLTDGIDHVATITADSDRLQRFYIDVFGATIERDRPEFPEGATDGVVTEFGRKLSIFFRDPDRMECEVLVANPDADEADLRFGTPSTRFPADS